MVPHLPNEIWRQILVPQDDFLGIAGKCLSLNFIDGPNLNTVMFDAKHVDGCFCKNSKTYRALRLVNKSFNSIVCEHIFSDVTIMYEKDLSFDKLEYLATKDHLRQCVKEFTFMCREPLDEDDEDDAFAGNNVWWSHDSDDEERPGNGTGKKKAKKMTVLEQKQLLDDRIGPEIFDTQSNLLSLCPHVSSLALDIGRETLPDLFGRSDTNNFRHFSNLGNFVFRAFLHACYQKTLVSPDCNRIKDLSIECLWEDCALESLTPSAIDQAVLGMSHIQRMHLRVVKMGSPPGPNGELQKPFDELLGKLLRGANQMQRLTLSSMNAENNRNCELHLDDIISYNDKHNLVVQQWKFLTYVDLENLGCHSVTLSSFINAHKSTLKHLHLTICFMTDSDVKKKKNKDNPWTKLFHDFKKCHPVEKKVYARLSNLSYGKSRRVVPDDVTSRLEEMLGT